MNRKEFAAKWVGRSFRCNASGEVVTLTLDQCTPRAFISVGEGAIDLGDGFYSRRLGDITELEASDDE